MATTTPRAPSGCIWPTLGLRNELLRFFVQKRCLKLAAKDDDTVVIDPTVPFETAGVWVHRFNDRSSLYFGSSY